MNNTIRHDKDGGFTVIPEKVINPPKKKYKKGMCVVCLKNLKTDTENKNMMCNKCETTTSKIANEFDVLDRFDIIENKDRKRWEFDPKRNWIGYTVSFFEAKTKEDAIISVWKALKLEKS